MSFKILYKFLFVIILLTQSFCSNKTRIENIQSQWSGMNPTSIPLQVRLKEEQKGNLITNPSFELGKFYNVDSTNLSFSLPGWKKLGENVAWTNTENSLEFNSDDASIGFHAIKITRNQSNETDVQGEGVITDYIRVIPGNYQLSFDIKLDHLRSNLQRFGTGVFDAVNIRVYCYDKNKVMIKNEAVHPVTNSEIDNSFKGYGFSGYDEIQKFGWHRVFGRTGNFPFEEGNLPQEARYVRIFAGLKGEGSMWIDRIDFRYTSSNFTLLEKLEPYFDTTLQRSSYLIPKPKKIAFYSEISLNSSDANQSKSLPGILLPLNADKTIKELVLRFIKIPIKTTKSNDQPLILSKINSQILEKQSIIFSFGNNMLSRQFSDQLPFEEIEDHKQSYFIHQLENIKNVIFIGYSDTEGLFHALHTLSQLIDLDNNTYHHYNIVDYPDYSSRSVIFNSDSDSICDKENWDSFSDLIAVGYNAWFARLPEMNLGNSNLKNTSKDWINFGSLKKYYPFIKMGISLEDLKIEELRDDQMNPGTVQEEELHREIPKLSLMLYQQLKELKKRDLDFVIFSDKTVWESILSSENGMINLTHEDFNKFLFYRSYFAKYYSGLDLKELPLNYLIPYYQGVGNKGTIFSELYANALADTSSNKWFDKILWHGPVQGASLIDPMDMYGFSKTSSLSYIDYSLTFRSESSYYGNYYSLFPGKALTGIIFKPFDTKITGINSEIFDDEILIKINDLSEVTQIRLATAADYLWNTSHYNPELSLWKVLLLKYGKETAKELVIFNDLYFKLLSVSLELEMHGLNQKIQKQGEELVIQINLHWERIVSLLNSQLNFLNELTNIKNSIILRFQESSNSAD